MTAHVYRRLLLLLEILVELAAIPAFASLYLLAEQWYWIKLSGRLNSGERFALTINYVAMLVLLSIVGSGGFGAAAWFNIKGIKRLTVVLLLMLVVVGLALGYEVWRLR